MGAAAPAGRQPTAAVDVADDAPVFEGDKALLRRVFGNLMQNAITHSAQPVAISLERARATVTACCSRSADNGPGIPPEYQEVIFRKFEQVHTPNAPRCAARGWASRSASSSWGRTAGGSGCRAPAADREARSTSSLPAEAAAADARRRRSPVPGVRVVKVYLRTFGCRANQPTAKRCAR